MNPGIRHNGWRNGEEFKNCGARNQGSVMLGVNSCISKRIWWETTAALELQWFMFWPKVAGKYRRKTKNLHLFMGFQRWSVYGVCLGGYPKNCWPGNMRIKDLRSFRSSLSSIKLIWWFPKIGVPLNHPSDFNRMSDCKSSSLEIPHGFTPTDSPKVARPGTKGLLRESSGHQPGMVPCFWSYDFGQPKNNWVFFWANGFLNINQQHFFRKHTG